MKFHISFGIVILTLVLIGGAGCTSPTSPKPTPQPPVIKSSTPTLPATQTTSSTLPVVGQSDTTTSITTPTPNPVQSVSTTPLSTSKTPNLGLQKEDLEKLKRDIQSLNVEDITAIAY